MNKVLITATREALRKGDRVYVYTHDHRRARRVSRMRVRRNGEIIVSLWNKEKIVLQPFDVMLIEYEEQRSYVAF